MSLIMRDSLELFILAAYYVRLIDMGDIHRFYV